MSQRKVHPIAAIIKSALNGNNNNHNRHVHFEEDEPQVVETPHTNHEDMTPKRPPPYPGHRQGPHPVAELIKSAFNNTNTNSDSENTDSTDDSDTEVHGVFKSPHPGHIRKAHRDSLDIAMLHQKKSEGPINKLRQHSVESPPPSPGTLPSTTRKTVTFTIPSALPQSPSESSLGSAEVPPSPVSPPPKIDVFVPPKDLSPPHDGRAGDLKDWRVCALDFTAREFLEPADLVEPCVWRERVVPSLVVRLWSRASRRYLRILDSGDVYGRSSFGPTGHFRLIQVGRVSPHQPVVILQCTANPDRHLAVLHNRLVGNANGGLQSEFIVVQNEAGFSTLEARCAPGQYLGIRPNGNVMKPADVPGRKSVEAQLVVQSEAAKI
ncbi:uncharacterized protein [Branchiostoma lanceolatum]|uniref:uncharacterized protein n=1 Tax=Branchiostoma lanceolatum TaxID=7740 RepID=UPI0034530372